VRIINALINLPSSRFKQKIRRIIAPTVAEGWEQYARHYQGKSGRYLGDEWICAEAMGVDVPADQIVLYIDENVIGPFFRTPKVILEIGSGGGRFTEALLPRCNKLLATDTSQAMLKLMRERFAHHPNIEYLLLNGMGLSPIPDKSIDAVFSYDVFVHIQHWDIFNYLSEISRVLVPGGKAIIHHSNTFSDLGWKRFLADVGPSLNRHKLPETFTLMTPEIMKEFTRRLCLILEDSITDVVRRDCISLIRKPNSFTTTSPCCEPCCGMLSRSSPKI